jgi:hypothetical protein
LPVIFLDPSPAKSAHNPARQVDFKTAFRPVVSVGVEDNPFVTLLLAIRQPSRDKGFGLRQGGARDYCQSWHKT